MGVVHQMTWWWHDILVFLLMQLAQHGMASWLVGWLVSKWYKHHYRHIYCIYIYMIIYWVCPLASNSGKWKCIGESPAKNVKILVVTGILGGGHTQIMHIYIYTLYIYTIWRCRRHNSFVGQRYVFGNEVSPGQVFKGSFPSLKIILPSKKRGVWIWFSQGSFGSPNH